MTASGPGFSFRCGFAALVLSLAVPLVAAPAQTFDLEDTIDGEASQGAPALDPAYGSGGADLVSGRYNRTSPGVSIGTAETGGLSWSAIWEHDGWRHSVMGGVSRVDADTVRVVIGDSVEDFNRSGSSWVADRANGSTLTSSSDSYTWTGRDGTVAEFKTVYAGTEQLYDHDLAYVERVSAPGGLVTRYHYAMLEFEQPPTYGACRDPGGFLVLCELDEGVSVGPIYRLQSVTTNTGYQLHFEYALANVWSSSHVAGWLQLDHVRAINIAVEYCAPSSNSCTLGVDWPRMDVSRTSSTRTFTDALGGCDALAD